MVQWGARHTAGCNIMETMETYQVNTSCNLWQWSLRQTADVIQSEQGKQIRRFEYYIYLEQMRWGGWWHSAASWCNKCPSRRSTWMEGLILSPVCREGTGGGEVLRHPGGVPHCLIWSVGDAVCVFSWRWWQSLWFLPTLKKRLLFLQHWTVPLEEGWCCRMVMAQTKSDGLWERGRMELMLCKTSCLKHFMMMEVSATVIVVGRVGLFWDCR